MPEPAALQQLLTAYAPLREAPLCPEILVHQARALVEVWEAAERLAGQPLPAPFWAYAWAGGAALARVVLDDPALVRGLRVLDFGAGGGVTSLAAAHAGATVTANDIDEWALLVVRIAARAQRLHVDTLHGDLCTEPESLRDFDVVLCSDLAYERREAPRQRHLLERAVADGKTVLLADAGRTYFDDRDLTLLARYTVNVPADLEGVARRTARVYRL